MNLALILLIIVPVLLLQTLVVVPAQIAYKLELSFFYKRYIKLMKSFKIYAVLLILIIGASLMIPVTEEGRQMILPVIGMIAIIPAIIAEFFVRKS